MPGVKGWAELPMGIGGPGAPEKSAPAPRLGGGGVWAFTLLGTSFIDSYPGGGGGGCVQTQRLQAHFASPQERPQQQSRGLVLCSARIQADIAAAVGRPTGSIRRHVGDLILESRRKPSSPTWQRGEKCIQT